MNIRFFESNTNLNTQALQSKKNSSNEKISSEEIEKIAPIEEKKEVNEELIAFYFNYEATQAMKSRVDTLFDEEYEEDKSLEYNELRQLARMKNLNEILEEKKEDKTFEVWA